jgi:hypothetical protein
MKYTVKVSIFDWIKNEHIYECGEPKTVIYFEFSRTEDMYETLITYARDFTYSFTYLDEWFCISTEDEAGVTIIEFKDYSTYIDEIALPIREMPYSENIFDERTSK